VGLWTEGSFSPSTDEGFELDDYDIETTELDDEQDPAEATVDIDYTVVQIATDQAQTYLTTFTVEDVDGDWVVTNFQTD